MKNIFRVLVFTFFIISCNDGNKEKYGFESIGDSNINAFTSSRNVKITQKLEEAEEVVEASDAKQISRKLIKNGRIVFETEDLKKTKTQVVSFVKKYNGYISSDNQNEYDNKINTHLKVRIPAKNFDTILSGISKEVGKFDSKEINVSDVTERFLDVQTRLKNKKELEKRFLEILKKAKSVKEILEVEREIGQLREDIEAAEGKLKYLQNQVSFSTLNISFYKTISNETKFSRKFKDGFINGFDNLKSFFIGIVNVWPFIILLCLVIFLFRKWRKKSKNK